MPGTVGAWGCPHSAFSSEGSDKFYEEKVSKGTDGGESGIF